MTVSRFLLSVAAIIVVGYISPSWGLSSRSSRSSSSSSSSWTTSDVVHVLEHLFSPPPPSFQASGTSSLEDIANTRIPGPPGSGVEILSYVATPTTTTTRRNNNNNKNNNKLPVLLLIHEFFGLNPSIVEKANALAEDLECIVVAPDTFRGTVTNFIPKAIWLALSTPTERVNDDLDAICAYLEETKNDDDNVATADTSNLAVMGFCYGGGKAIQYTTQRRPNAATVIFYGKPVTDVDQLAKLKAPVCGIYGRDDIQFPMSLIDQFKEALSTSSNNNNIIDNTVIKVYDGVGHAFWSDMDQIRMGQQPQTDAYNQCNQFLRNFFSSSSSSSSS